MLHCTYVLHLCVSCLQILQLYKDYIDPDFTWSNFTVEEQAKVIVAPRSNNLLDTERVRGGAGSQRLACGASELAGLCLVLKTSVVGVAAAYACKSGGPDQHTVFLPLCTRRSCLNSPRYCPSRTP